MNRPTRSQPTPHPSPSYIYPPTSHPPTPSLLLSRPTSQTRLHTTNNNDWVARTASTLTLTSLEEKGQSWLAARHSSTAGLITTPDEDEGPDFVDVLEGEGEMRRVVWGGLGGWVDWAVGWLDLRGGEGDEGGDGNEGRGELDAVELQRRLRRKEREDRDRDLDQEGGGGDTNSMSCAPESAGMWRDAKWLLGVAAKAAL